MSDELEIQELNDDDLEAVSGGASFCCCSTTGGNCSNDSGKELEAISA